MVAVVVAAEEEGVVAVEEAAVNSDELDTKGSVSWYVVRRYNLKMVTYVAENTHGLCRIPLGDDDSYPTENEKSKL